MPNLLILTEVQEAMRARYKAMLLERFPQLTINVVGQHNGNMCKSFAGDFKNMINIVQRPASWGD